MDDVVVITLFRHGITEENKRQAYLGWNDSPLCSSEIVKLKNYQLPEQQLVFSSDLGRCLETAKHLYPDKTPEKLAEFREMHFGEWTGKTYVELENNSDYRNWLDDFNTVAPPKGERYLEFAHRVERGWEEIIARMMLINENRATLITHGGVIKYLLTRYAPEQKEFWDWKVPHGGGFELVWEIEGWRRKARCTLLREVASTENQSGFESSTN
jgi:alpha-ribazole phosphatase